MANQIHNDSDKRHDFIMLMDVQDGNPNGDPDAGNLPRVDPETMQGLMTDGCLKRKVRNYVDLTRGHEERFKIYVQNHGLTLNELHQRAYTATQIRSTGTKQNRDEVAKVRRWMCDNYYDIRIFGAVMSTRVNCGQVRGPVQLTFARSIDPVVPLEITITRGAVVLTPAITDADKGQSTPTNARRSEIGRKAIVPYGLYRTFGFISPMLASQTGFSREDLELFWRALLEMWDYDRSAAHGLMACRGLYVFSHTSMTGNAPADQLFALVEVKRKAENISPRSFADYEVIIRREDLPKGVQLNCLL